MDRRAVTRYSCMLSHSPVDLQRAAAKRTGALRPSFDSRTSRRCPIAHALTAKVILHHQSWAPASAIAIPSREKMMLLPRGEGRRPKRAAREKSRLGEGSEVEARKAISGLVSAALVVSSTITLQRISSPSSNREPIRTVTLSSRAESSSEIRARCLAACIIKHLCADILFNPTRPSSRRSLLRMRRSIRHPSKDACSVRGTCTSRRNDTSCRKGICDPRCSRRHTSCP